MRGTIRRRGKHSWQIAVSAGFDPKTGRRIRIWRTVRGTRKDAERELARLLHEAAHGTLVDPGRATVEEWLRTWLDLKRPTLSTKTYERYEEIVRLHLVPALGQIRLHRLHPHHVQRLYADLLEAGKHPRTVLDVHRTLHAALETAVRQQVVGRNVCDAVEPPKVPSRELRVLTEEELRTVLRAAEGTRLYVPILLAALCGLRRGEVLALRWGDVDLERGVLYVRRSLEETRWGLAFKEPKTGRSRAVAMPPQVAEALRRHRKAQLEERLQQGPAWQDYDLVCPAANGAPWWPSNFRREFERFWRTLPVPPFTFHALRHTHATHLIRSGADIRTVAARLGHSTPTLTLNTYGHELPGAQEEAVRRLVDRLWGPDRS